MGRGLRLAAAGLCALVCAAPAAAHTDGGTGTHLDLELRYGGTAIDPAPPFPVGVLETVRR